MNRIQALLLLGCLCGLGVVLAANCNNVQETTPWLDGGRAEAGAQRKTITVTSSEDFLKGELVGVSADTEGDLTLSGNLSIRDTPFIWIPNSTDRTITQIDTRTLAVTGTHGLKNANGVDCYNPSRTTVDIEGNVWVGCRGTSSYIQRGGVGAKKVPEEVDHKVVKLAKADGRVLLSIRVGNAPRALALDASNHLWVGCSVDDTVWELDGVTGECLRGDGCAQPAISVSDFPYGAAVDQRGHLWMMSKGDSAPGESDSCVISEINTATGEKLGQYGPYKRKNDCAQLYGIAIDGYNDVWLGGHGCSDVVRIKGVAGVHPLDGKTYNAGQMIAYYDIAGKNSRGVAIDLDNNVWVAMSGTATATKLNGATGQILKTVNVGSSPIGVAVDAVGNAWVVNQGSDSVHRINGLDSNQKPEIKVGAGPYTYSDMLGTALRQITYRGQTEATWQRKFDGGEANPQWREIIWDADVPSGSSLHMRYRCAATETALDAGTWSSPTIASPARISCSGRWLQVQVTFVPGAGNQSPVLHFLTLHWE